MNRHRILCVFACSFSIIVAPAVSEAQDPNVPSGAPEVITGGSGDVNAAGQAAARKGDTTDGSNPIAGGSKDVFINGRPAVTMGDKTSCGGTVVGGASNIFINGKPIARTGDLTASCAQK